jgi:hypothetical protein
MVMSARILSIVIDVVFINIFLVKLDMFFG